MTLGNSNYCYPRFFSWERIIMKMSARFLMGFLVLAFMSSGALLNSAIAQDKAKDAKAAPAAKVEKGKATIKVLLENDKVRVYETTYKPGDVNTSIASSATRINRIMKGGTLERTYADGKKETNTRKTGEVVFNAQIPAYTTKNIGKTDYQTYTVQLK
jgi:hypothetical protein